MSNFQAAIFYGLIAGIMIPVGGLIARVEHVRPGWLETEFRHSVMAFGGGVLIAAVALVLVPQGIKGLPPGMALLAFALGGVIFAYFDRPAKSSGSKAQLWAMLIDFVPEAIALGAMLAEEARDAGLLALLIGLQNLPEGFNAYRELADNRSGPGRSRILPLFLLLGLLGPLAGVTGYLFLAGQTEITSFIMMMASGGILFLMFEDIAPRAHLQNRKAPSLAALAGFSLGLMSEMLLG